MVLVIVVVRGMVVLLVMCIVIVTTATFCKGQESSSPVWALADYYAGLKVVINEVEVNSRDSDSDLRTVDWVELFNPGDSSVDLSGWYVEAHIRCESEGCTWGGIRWSDPIPEGTLILPGGFYMVRRANRWMTNSGTHALALYSPVRVTYEVVLAVLIDLACNGSCENPYTSFCDTANDSRTLQRIPDGSGVWKLSEGTPGRSNAYSSD
jgi:hypothetical protein